MGDSFYRHLKAVNGPGEHLRLPRQAALPDRLSGAGREEWGLRGR